MKRFALLGLLVLLAACVPQTSTPNPQTPTTRVETPPAFYPAQTGLEWTYQPPGASSLEAPYKLTIDGQSPFNNQVAFRYRFSGRGQQRVYYRQVDALGVRLLGFEELVTNTVTRFDPPIQEYPPQGNLAVGARWGGLTRYSVDLTTNGKISRFAEGSFEYTYTVLGRSTVTVFNNVYDVLRISLERKPTDGEAERYEIWFLPNVGEIRTQEGLQLQGKNFGTN